MNAPRTRRTLRAALSAVAVSVVAVLSLATGGLGTTTADAGSSADVVSATKEHKLALKTKEW